MSCDMCPIGRHGAVSEVRVCKPVSLMGPLNGKAFRSFGIKENPAVPVSMEWEETESPHRPGASVSSK